ncbi:MAG TPA: serine/threonine protein kinase [Polyangiaceae bacterium]|nr:serine/threonine protein kinase [Polyangiaceae bacterium]
MKAPLAGRYRLGELIGEGAAGTVYDAFDERLGRAVALKLVRQSLASDPETVGRAEREARATASLDHANIVTVTDVGLTEVGLPYVAMERLEGETLAQRIERGPLTAADAIDIHMQLLDALDAAHDAGILHRDVKPSNVFLVELANGVLVKLLDFGLALYLEGEARPKLTGASTVVGSLAYLPPERLLGEPYDERADVYAVGVSLFQTLSGECPFEGANALVVRGKIVGVRAPELSSKVPDAGAGLTEVVARALAKDPRERFESARAMRAALGEVKVGAEPERGPEQRAAASLTPPSKPRPASEPRGTSRGWVASAVGVALALTLGAAAVLSERADPPFEPTTPAPRASVGVDPDVDHPNDPPEGPAPPAATEPADRTTAAQTDAEQTPEQTTGQTTGRATAPAPRQVPEPIGRPAARRRPTSPSVSRRGPEEPPPAADRQPASEAVEPEPTPTPADPAETYRALEQLQTPDW